MKTTTLSIEAIGDNIHEMAAGFDRLCKDLGFSPQGGVPAPYWAAEITGTHPRFKLERRFLPGHKDFTNANSVGSRGVQVHYFLEEGKLYEVKERCSWRRTERYFCVVRGGKIVTVSDEEAQAMAEEMDRRQWAGSDT